MKFWVQNGRLCADATDRLTLCDVCPPDVTPPEPVPPTVSACDTGNSTSGTTVALDRVGGTAVDDLYIACIWHVVTGGNSITGVPSGWVALRYVTLANGTEAMWVGYRKPSGSEPAAWTWTFATGAEHVAFLSYVSGADIPSASSSNTGTGNTMTATSVACGDDTLGIACYFAQSRTAPHTSSDTASCSATTLNGSVQSFRYLASAPNTGNRTATFAGSALLQWAAVNVAIDPF